jgi:hypothetical protein
MTRGNIEQGMLKLAIALALVVVSVQCAAACTPSAQPACPHHKQAPACSHELVPATIVQSSVADLSFSSEAIHAPIILRAVLFFQPCAAQDPSPPDLTLPRFTLRI